MIKPWSYTKEYKDLREQILKSIDSTLKSGKIFFGKELRKFEKSFVKKNNSKYGIAVGSGTDAIYITLLGLGIGSGDEVITVSNTAIATVSAIRATGASVRFVDIDKYYLMDVNKVEKCISKKTKAIIPVHLYGQSCDMEKICKIAKKYRLKVIEDCAQAQGSLYKNKNVGSFGIAGCFSFYPTKILGAYGDGGFVTTSSLKLYKKIRRIRFYGIELNDKKNNFNNKYYSNEHGINSRLDEIQSTILNIKLSKVNLWINERKKLAKIYYDNLKDTSLTLPKVKNECKHVFHLYVVYHPKRNEIMRKLKRQKIKLNINYPYPIHKMKAYNKHTCIKFKNLNITENVSKGIFSLPLYPNLAEKYVLKISKVLKQILSQNNW